MGQHNIDIAIRARDEASATINRMGGLFRTGLNLWAVERGAAAAARAYQLFSLSAARADAAMAGDAQGALEKHLELNEAWKDTIRLIPGARPLANAFFDAFSREKEIKKTIETIKALTAATEAAGKKADEWGNAAEIAAAKMRKAPESEIAAIRAKQGAEGRGKDIEQIQKELDEGQKEYTIQKERLDTMLADIRGSSPLETAGLIWRGETAGGLQEQLAVVKQLKAKIDEAKADLLRLKASAQTLQKEGQEEARQKRVEEGGLWVGGGWIPSKKTVEDDKARVEAAQKKAAEDKRLADEAARSAAQAAKAEQDKFDAIHAAQDRAFNATHDSRERELRDIDLYYIKQQMKWRENAEVMAALQDAYHEERAAALGRFANEDAAIQAREAEKVQAEAEQKVRAAFGGDWRAAPTASARFLTGIGPEQQTLQEARQTNRFLDAIAKLLKPVSDAAGKESQNSALTVQIEGG
jgi:hypothetical protein